MGCRLAHAYAVSVGACLIMIVSAFGFGGVLGPNVILDPSRVAAQVVILAILTVVKPFEEWLQHRNKQYEMSLWADPQTVDILNQVFGYRAKRTTRFIASPDEDGTSDKIQLTVSRLPADEITDMFNTLAALPYVQKVVRSDSI